MALTKDQNITIAAKLVGTKANVYMVAKSLFGSYFAWGDEDFDRLKADTGLFRCEECNEWFDGSMEDGSISGFCVECVNDM